MRKDTMWRRAWVEIDIGALQDNFLAVRRTIASSCKLCCVVKANAYGHGAVVVASLYERLGADFLAVSNIEEALELRFGGITLPILILGYTAPESAMMLAANNISQCVFSLDYAEALSREAKKANVTVKIHVKLDSGMGRIGFPVRDGAQFEKNIDEIVTALSLDNLCREGIFTHFAKSDMGDEGDEFTKRQFDRFQAAIEALKTRGYTFLIRHAANSAAILDHPDTCLDMVRAGIVLYGYAPSGDVRRSLSLRPALSLKTVIDMVKVMEVGESVSYGGRFVASEPTTIATVPIGYADGLWRGMGDLGLYPVVKGQKTALVGRICMDQCMLNLTNAENACVGDTVTVYGTGGESIEALALRCGTIPYELICALGERLPRVYFENGEIVAIKDRILPAGYSL